MDKQGIRIIQVGENQPEQRIDRFVAAYLGMSRSGLSKLFSSAKIRLNGQVAKASLRIKQGDLIEVRLAETDRQVPSSIDDFDYKVEVVYEDDQILVINKPRNLICHPGVKQDRHTLVDWLSKYLGSLPQAGQPGREGLVHRLDQATTGGLVLAKDQASYLALASQFKARTVGRHYLAITYGQPPSPAGLVEYAIGRNPSRPMTYACRPDGRQAITEFKCKDRSSNHALLACSLGTGRTHQIRVHLQALGCPVWGDKIYSRLAKTDDILGLHAYKLTFNHPKNLSRMEFTVDPPTDFSLLLDDLGLVFRPDHSN